MNIKHIEEPELQFGNSKHIDIKFGIMNYGVFDFAQQDAPKKINLSIISTNEEIEKVLEWIDACRRVVPAKKSNKKNLFPSFPGVGPDHSFFAEIMTTPSTQRIITGTDIAELSKMDWDARVRFAVSIFNKEIEYLASKSHKIDVVLCVIPRRMAEMFAVKATEEDDEGDASLNTGEAKLDFRRLLKAESLRYRIPIQIVLPSTYDDSIKRSLKIGSIAELSLQDKATRAWNIFTALYYKAGGVPWRLIRSADDYQTCYIGVSFYHSRDMQTMQTSVAQVFNERGEGIIIRGGYAMTSKEDRQIHLDGEGAYTLIQNALQKYIQEHRTRPARVVLYKTSDYDKDELEGFTRGIKDERVELLDLMALSKSLTRLHRNGKYPPLRGTFWELDDVTQILYTKGSVDFYQTYPGLYIPRTLKIKIASSEQTPKYLASEILALTKMNWNNAQFDNSMPITIKAARQVGEILRYVEDSGYVEPSYCFYM
jgi:hypothetical protein